MPKNEKDNDTIKALGFEDYAALWGADPVYDKPPQERGDGYLFYNFAVEGKDPEFLKKFLPAIDRCFKMMMESDEFDKAEKAKNAVNLKLLKKEVQRRLAKKP